MCQSHYLKAQRALQGRQRQREYYAATCVTCETPFRSSRRDGKFCSDDCRAIEYRQRDIRPPNAMRLCRLPADHPVMLALAAAKAAERAARQKPKPEPYQWRTARQCPGCACWFTPLHTPNAVTCSKRCHAKCARRRRRAREHSAQGSWAWSDFMRIAKKFGYHCAYCGTKPDRLDPDHVVPLSRGGYDSPANLLPTCLMCNSSKCAMTLVEWREWRAERGLEPRATTWELGDHRYTHLTQAMLSISPAA